MPAYIKQKTCEEIRAEYKRSRKAAQFILDLTTSRGHKMFSTGRVFNAESFRGYSIVAPVFTQALAFLVDDGWLEEIAVGVYCKTKMMIDNLPAYEDLSHVADETKEEAHDRAMKHRSYRREERRNVFQLAR